MIWAASSKHRSVRTARMWNSRSPGVATACRGPERISRNGCSPAGRTQPAASLLQALWLSPVTQLRNPSKSRNPTARTSAGRSAMRSRTVSSAASPGLISTTRNAAAPLSGVTTAWGSGAASAAGFGLTWTSFPTAGRARVRGGGMAAMLGRLHPDVDSGRLR